ncbi:uncharacterized protein rab44 isoform X2 [Nelusetta ayraudi]|uniref:uncharacterized protein rab44 isoform X2 n=1 Tax=Nelusetta ayraudi TaxID=303726 RepID=UPI003F7170A1
MTLTDVSVNKEEEVNCENKQDDHQTEAMALGANILNDTKNTQVGGMDRADTEPGVVYKSEDQVDDATKSQALDSDVQANLDLPPTQLQQMDSISNLVGGRRKLGSSRRKKLKPHGQDTDLSQQPAEEDTGHSADHEPLEATFSLASETEVSDQGEEIAHGVTHGDIPELDASNLLSSATSNQQSAEVRQGLLSMFSATEGKEQEEYSDLLGQDQNLQLLANESQMKSTNKEASTVLMITTDKSKSENQSGIKSSSDPATLSEEDKDHANLPEGRGFLCSVDSYVKVDEDVDKPPVGDSLVLQSDSSLQSVVDGESTHSVPGGEILLSENTVTDMEIEESANKHDGDRRDSRYESVTTDSIQAVEADSHPSFENYLGQTITIDHALEEFAKEVGMSISMQGSEDLTEETSAQEKNEALDQFGFQENSREEPTGNMPEEAQQSTAEGACSIQQIHFDNCENLQTQTKQKRRKMGSTRRANFNRKQEEDDNNNETKSTQADPNDVEEVKEVDEQLSSIITEVSCSENTEAPTNPQNTNVSDNSIQSNTETNVSTAVVKGEVNSVILVKTDDIKNSERNSDASMEELQPDDLIGAETSSTLNPGHATNTDWSFECVDGVTQGTQADEDRLESVLPDQLLESASKLIVASNLEKVKSELGVEDGENPNNLFGEVKVDENLEVRSGSLKSEAKRRKMGSTRKSLASRREGEDSSCKLVEDREATEEAKNAQGINTGALKTEDNELTQPKVIVLETVEQSCASESYSRPQATAEEDQLARSFTPQTVSTSPQPDAMSETAAGGRRRKLGSHRKSHGYQRGQIPGQKETGDSQTEASKSSLINAKVTKAAMEKSQSLDKISEDEGDKKTPSDTTTARAAEQPNLLQGRTSTQETAAQHPSTKRPGSPESQKILSLEHSSGEALPSKRYNVILIGDSSVGKTSFMKRVETGMFSLDLPASVGTDSCISSVLVDGKRVVLQLWDTAGQERFHSITRQIFHKAQAFLLMYDITSSQSFSDISYWANCIQESASDNVTILMLGNKSDSGTRQVKSQDGEILAKEYNFQFMECSAATGHNVTQSLETMARVLSEKCDTREEAMLLRQEPQKKKSSGCC